MTTEQSTHEVETEAVEDISEEVATATQEDSSVDDAYQQLEQQYRRLHADFDNFRRRTQAERASLGSLVKGTVLTDILPVLDNLERALEVPVTDATQSIHDGVSMIYTSFIEQLRKHGLAAIEEVGVPFDPQYHQAVLHGPEEGFADNTVAHILQKGYQVDGRVIRPAMVKVAQE